MTIDKDNIDAIVNDQSPGMPLMVKTTEAVRRTHKDLSNDRHKVIAQALVDYGAVGLDGEGEFMVKHNRLEVVQLLAPRLLAKPPAPALSPIEKRARIDGAVEARKAQDKRLQGGSPRTKARLAMIREEEMEKLGKGNP